VVISLPETKGGTRRKNTLPVRNIHKRNESELRTPSTAKVCLEKKKNVEGPARGALRHACSEELNLRGGSGGTIIKIVCGNNKLSEEAAGKIQGINEGAVPRGTSKPYHFQGPSFIDPSGK